MLAAICLGSTRCPTSCHCTSTRSGQTESDRAEVGPAAAAAAWADLPGRELGARYLVHPRERLLARLLWLGGVVVQVVLLMGVLRLVA